MFKAQTGDVDLQQQDVNGRGEYFINSGVQNCGIKGRTDRLAKVFPANTITVDFLGNTYYRSFPYKMATHNHVFSLSGKALKNELVGLYFVAQMSYLSKIYSFSDMGTWPRIKEQVIHMPVTKKGNIDFAFIEEYVSKLKKESIIEIEAFILRAGFKDCTLLKKEENALQEIKRGTKNMQRFFIVEQFNVSNSHNILKSDVVFGSGTTPYVTASEGNNSIVSYISYNPEMTERGNSIMIGGKTLVITYQPRDFFSNDSHNLILVIKDEEGRNEAAQLYMVAALYKTLGPKYSWGDSISKKKIKDDVIYLPVISNGTDIDYDFMATYITAVKKQCIAKLKQEIISEFTANKQVLFEQDNKVLSIELGMADNLYIEKESESMMAAEPFECYQWERFDKSISDFFGGDKTILIGCFKGKKYIDWILANSIYNIRLGKAKGSMEENRELFNKTSLLVLYELGKPNNLSVYKIISNKEMSKEELLAMNYPNKKPRKSYMTFNIAPLEMDLSFLGEQHLIERLIELNSENAKGTPVFIRP